MLAAFAALGSDAQLFAQVRHSARAFAAAFSNLTVSDLSADANVHDEPSVAVNLKS